MKSTGVLIGGSKIPLLPLKGIKSTRTIKYPLVKDTANASAMDILRHPKRYMYQNRLLISKRHD